MPKKFLGNICLDGETIVLFVIGLAAAGSVLFASPAVAAPFRALVWDSKYGVSIFNLLAVRYLPRFMAEVFVPIIVLLIFGLGLFLLKQKSKGQLASSVVCVVALLVSSLPSFVIAILIGGSSNQFIVFLKVSFVAILGNTTTYIFLKEQSEFLDSELKSDYIEAARIRGSKVWPHLKHKYISSLLYSISRVYPLIITALIVAEQSLKYENGLCLIVLNRFGEYLSSPVQNSHGLGYLVWFIAICLSVQMLIKIARFHVFGKRLKHYSSFRQDIHFLAEDDNTTDRSVRSRLSVNYKKTENTDDLVISHSKYKEDTEYDREAWLMVLIRIRSLKTVSLKIISNNRFETVLCLVSSIIIISLAILGKSQQNKQSYLSRVIAEESLLISLRESSGISHYWPSIRNGLLVYSSVKSESFFEKANNLDVRTNGVVSQDFDGMGGFLSASLESEIVGGSPVSTGAIRTSSGRDYSSIRLAGMASWRHSEIVDTFVDGKRLATSFPLGTNANGESVLRTVAVAVSEYPSRLILIGLIAGIGGLILGIVNGYLYRKSIGFTLFNQRLQAFGIIDWLIDVIESIPKIVLILIFLPLLPSNKAESVYFSYLMATLGFLLIPTIYKVVFEHIQIFFDRDFVDAEEMIGKSFWEITIINILLHNSATQFLGALIRTFSVAILVESSLSSLNLIKDRYDSLAALIPTNITFVSNSLEIIAPIAAICLMLIMFNTLADLLTAGEAGVQ